MPLAIKLLFTAFALTVVPLALWVLRPSQSKAVSPKWFRLGPADPMFRALFRPDGKPSRFTWALVVGWVALWLVLVWVVPTTP